MFGAGFVALSLWLVRHDIALKNLRHAPHLQFFGACMSAGYLWLGVAGLALIATPPSTLAYGYDLALHAVLIGFVLSMAMGHSVIVIPAITGAAAPFHRAMYLGFAALHASVALRVASDLTAWDCGRMASEPLTILGSSPISLSSRGKSAAPPAGRSADAAMAFSAAVEAEPAIPARSSADCRR